MSQPCLSIDLGWRQLTDGVNMGDGVWRQNGGWRQQVAATVAPHVGACRNSVFGSFHQREPRMFEGFLGWMEGAKANVFEARGTKYVVCYVVRLNTRAHVQLH